MNYEAILKNLQEYYSNLLIVQYHGKTKAKATVEKLVNLIYANMILLQIEYAYDWKTATGKQLDIIGQWVGVNRSYNLPALQGRTLFAYPQTSRLYPTDNTSERQHGYSTYDTYSSVTDGGMLRYDDLRMIDRQLTDDEFRVVIGLKIIFNNINHTAGEIDEAVWKYFGGQTLYYKEPLMYDTKVYADKDFTQELGQVYNFDALTIGKATQTEWSSIYFEQEAMSSIKIEFVNNIYMIFAYSPSSGVSTIDWSEELEGEWTKTYVGGRPIKVYYTDGLYYAYTHIGSCYKTSDLNIQQWEYVSRMNDNITTLKDIAYGNGKYVAVVNDYSTGQISISEDGINWSNPINIGDINYYDFDNIYFYDDKFIVCGFFGTKYSYDGINWENIVRLPNSANRGFSFSSGIAYGNNMFVGTNASGNIAISTDGINWNFTNKKIDNAGITGANIFYANNLFIQITNSNEIPYTRDTSRINVSSDGLNWNTIQEVSDWIRALTVGFHKIVGVLAENTSGFNHTIGVAYTDINYIDTSFVQYQYMQNHNQQIQVGDVYTTWQPHQLTYNYPESLEKVMDYCEYKGILPAPTGVNIQTSLY